MELLLRLQEDGCCRYTSPSQAFLGGFDGRFHLPFGGAVAVGFPKVRGVGLAEEGEGGRDYQAGFRGQAEDQQARHRVR